MENASRRARVVLDTNVVVSALISLHGPPARLLDNIISGNLHLLWDDRILDEYQEVLHRPRFAFPPRRVADFLEYVEAAGERVTTPTRQPTLPDPTDHMFLEVACAGQANALITGNKKHFPAGACKPVQVFSPQEFLTLWVR